MILPATVFGLATTLSGPLLTTNTSPDYYAILCRLPLVILSTWMELLVFDLSNQRQPGSAVEDAVNKPWRPIPSGRISEAAARHLLMAAIPATIIKSVLLGTTLETLVFFILTWIYNDLAASESHYLIRTLINALGISTYSASAAAVAARIPAPLPLPLHTYTLPLGPQHLTISTPLTPRFYTWLLLLSLAIFLTITTQDLPDLPGDAAKGRPSMPLAIGEARARWSIAAGSM
ncbi:Fumagillin beta-trans-bergamotene synthase [Lasiodiplodia theobromae]|uniref:Fumagillin beta-trans-bergamotene synthase n=1 Tax=Lasiodiplodia theobromae TaxID=45133 RepID=A0A5N5CVF5_9PEZI|nr:Fumagillin beta-trans-bergamotene synthase [Lasiodiplodia theobromae]